MSQLEKHARPCLPIRSDLIAWAQLVELTSVEPATMAELLDMGWIDPVRTGAEDYLFRSRDVYRIQKLMRLCHDLEIPFGAGSIIVDLLERVERLEHEISEFKQLL
ncbi:MAG: MerR family transcriptional regulator [Desulfovibrionaceae bacterium CG1_02_65_16]|nr:MAG: MerR family transcriptional regulator [Desulfovibrionaceae bacterium CG1_02_65_16]